ncbi:MAG: metal ABC transporter solute-binding protein, Zn/Mn family [Gammaproteobacteria bacterium]
MRGVLTTLCLLAILAGVPSVRAEETIKVFVSILPQKYFAERIGGARVQVESLVRPGFNAETYELSPRQVASLSVADVYFRIGVPFESIWIKKISAVNPALKIIDCCHELMPAKHQSGKQQLDNPVMHAYDAHVWTSPRNAMYIANLVVKTLIDMDPASREYYESNHTRLVQDVNDLDEFIRQELASLPNRYLVVAHPSWSHFADAYGLEQVALERHGTEIRPRELSELVEFARSNNIHTVYVEKQFSSAAARLLAAEIGAAIKELDPLAEDYISNMKNTAQAIKAGAR